MSTQQSPPSAETTHFGFQQVPVTEKAQRVAEVFDSVAPSYDLMNDLMSLGIHRLWKRFTVAAANVRAGHKVLDLAGGTGDLALTFSRQVGADGLVVLSDINGAMLDVGRDRLLDKGLGNVHYVKADAQFLPFPDNYFNCITIAFGLRNVTDKQQALRAMHRVLKPGGQALILEFSKVTIAPLRAIYDLYSFKILPWLGKKIADDEDSYRYLAESIRMHPDQETLKAMMQDAGFSHCQYHNLSAGIVAVHRAYKL